MAPIQPGGLFMIRLFVRCIINDFVRIRDITLGKHFNDYAPEWSPSKSASNSTRVDSRKRLSMLKYEQQRMSSVA